MEEGGEAGDEDTNRDGSSMTPQGDGVVVVQRFGGWERSSLGKDPEAGSSWDVRNADSV